MTKGPEQNSKRSQKRRARGFVASRCNRRATKRLNSALGVYKSGDASLTQPGSIKHW